MFKRVAGPWRLPSFSEAQPQTARVRKGRDTVVRRVRAPGQRPAGADWEPGSMLPTSPPIGTLGKNF